MKFYVMSTEKLIFSTVNSDELICRDTRFNHPVKSLYYLIFKKQKATSSNFFKPNIDMLFRRVIRLSLTSLFLAGLISSTVSAQPAYNICGSIKNGYGPYDFRNERDKLPIVTGAHFTPEVEALIKGTTGERPGGDIDYTLRAIPNHPNALIAMVRLGEKEKRDQPSGAKYTVECYLERAIRFRSDDQVVRMIYAKFLIDKNRLPEAMAQLQSAKKLAKDNPFTHYNLGLIFFDLKEYEESLAEAHLAYQLGFLQPELRNKLQASGHWRPLKSPETDAATPSTGAASAP